MTRRWIVLAGAVCVLVGACTANSTKPTSVSNTSGGASAASTVGITKSTIKISLIASDLSVLTQEHLAPDIGNSVQTAQAVVDEINASGGVAGRKIQLITHILKGAAAVLSPAAGQDACIAATEDDKPFAVIITAAITEDVTQCVADQHDVLTFTMDSWPEQFYTAADGRLFSGATQLSIAGEREYKAWPKILDGVGALKGKTIGIILGDVPDELDDVNGGLKPGLADLGYKVAAETILPCPEGSQTCAQQDVAIQKMKDAHVNFVFLPAETLIGAATVEAAQSLHFHPQWTTIGDNVTNTVAQFFVSAKADYNGAWGVYGGFDDPTPDAVKCNDIIRRRMHLDYTVGSDAYMFAAATCMQIQTVTNAIAQVKGPITQGAVIKQLESLSSLPMIAGPPGSFSPTKHDGGDYVFLSRYDAAKGVFVPIDDEKPVKVG